MVANILPVFAFVYLSITIGGADRAELGGSYHGTGKPNGRTNIKDVEELWNNEAETGNTVQSPASNDTSDIPEWINEWEAPNYMRQWFPYYLTGHDHEGSPVFVFEVGNWKFSEALRHGPGGPEKIKELYIKYMNQGVLQFVRAGRANGGQGVSCILDYNDFSLANFADPTAVEMALRLLAQLGRAYSVMNYALLINTNFSAENFLRLAKPLMGNILEKCEIYGSQKAKWLPHLLRRIPKSQLPPWFGGGAQDWKPLWIGGTSFNSSYV